MTTETLAKDVSKRAGWSIFMGIVTAAIGVFMIAYPYSTAVASTIFVGWMLVFGGAAQFIYAFSSQTAGSFFLKILLAVLYGIAGVSLLAFPNIGVSTLTVLLGSMLILEAVLEASFAFSLPAGRGRAWLLVSSFASLALGLLILFEWPVSNGWAMGTFVGVAVLMNGISRIVVSTAIRSGAIQVDRAIKAA
jgi:uncharacterized membrane protein HdeD (DUF308 family)